MGLDGIQHNNYSGNLKNNKIELKVINDVSSNNTNKKNQTVLDRILDTVTFGNAEELKERYFSKKDNKDANANVYLSENVEYKEKLDQQIANIDATIEECNKEVEPINEKLEELYKIEKAATQINTKYAFISGASSYGQFDQSILNNTNDTFHNMSQEDIDKYIKQNTEFNSYEDFKKYVNELENEKAAYEALLYKLECQKNMARYDLLLKTDDYVQYKDDTKVENDLSKYVSIDYSNGGHATIKVNYKKYCEEYGEVSQLDFLKAIKEKYDSYDISLSSASIIGDIENIEDMLNLLDLEEDYPDLTKMYNYLYYTKGSEEAENYIMSTQDAIHQLAGYRKAQKWLNNLSSEDDMKEAILNHMKTSVKGLGTGVVNFTDGIAYSIEAMNVLDEGTRVYSTNQYENMYILQALSNPEDIIGERTNPSNTFSFTSILNNESPLLDENKTGHFLNENYEISQSIGNMLPSVAISCLLSPAVGQTLMGVSAAGNAYNGAMVEGNSKLSSVIYGAEVGLSEALLEKYLGGIPGLGDVKVTSLKTLGKAMGNEMIEEGLQTWIDNGVFRTLTLGEDFDVNATMTESAKSALYGAITAGIMQGPNVVISGMNNIGVKRNNKLDIDANNIDSLKKLEIQTSGKLSESSNSIINADMKQNTAAKISTSMTAFENSRRKSIFDIFKRKKTGKIEQTAFDYMPSLTDPAKAKEYLLNPDTINEPIYGQQWGKEFVYKYCEGINNNGVLPYNVGKSLVNLLDGQSYVGVHKTSVSGQNLSNIMNEGLNINPAGIMQGIASNSITIDNNVKEIYHGQVELISEIKGTSSFRSFETNMPADKTILVKHPNGVNPLINVNGQVKVDPKYIVGYVPVENGVVGEIVYNKNYYDYKKESFAFNIDDFELILSKGLNDTLLGEKSGINKNPIVDQGIFDVHNFLIDNNPHYKKTWNAISSNPYVKCNLEITSDRDHYSWNEGIRISPSTFLSQSYEVYFHEIGHALLSSNITHYSQVVNQFNKILNNNAETIKNRADPLFEVAKRLHQTASMMAYQVTMLEGMDPISNTTFNYQNQLREGIIRNSGFCSVMDIYDAVTTGKMHDTQDRWYGHGEQYYKRSFDQKFQEIFANFHALKCINNPSMNDFCKNLIGNEMWNFLEKTCDDALNVRLTKNDANTTAALLKGGYKNNNAALHSPTVVNSRVNMINTMSYQERFNYIIQNISQKYPNWLNYLNAYINGNGDITKITRYNDCRLVAKTIPLSEFTRMYNKLNITEILKSFSKDNMTISRNIPNVVNQFLKRPGDAYHKLININTIQKSYPNKFEYDQFMNKYSEHNGYSIYDQSGYFKHIRYGVQPTSINHRLYINCEPTMTYKFLDYFANACKQKGLSFYFKTAYLYNEIGNGYPINKSALTRSESAVIYASSSDIIEYINICKQIKMQHPELSFYEPPIATGSIDGWLGYGVEPSGRTAQVAREEGLANSFNKIRSEMLERGIYDGIKSCIKNNTNLQYFNGQTISHLYVNELYNTIINKYPTMIDAHKQILYRELNNNFAHYMNVICSSDKPYWQFRAQLNGHNNMDILTVDADMIKESLKNFHFNYTINDPGVYRYINFSIKKYARHFYIDENNLYLSE